RLDEVVDVGVQAGVVAARPSSEPPAQGRELEGLREVSERVTVRPQLILEHRSPSPRLDPGRPRHGIDLEHAIQSRQINRDGAGERRAHVALDAAYYCRAGAVRHGGSV